MNEANERSVASAGSQPVAWMVQNDDGERWLCHNYPAAAKYGLKCFPLYEKPQPTLTDEEREAIELAATWFAREIYESKSIPVGDTLRSLLERASKGTAGGQENEQ